MSASARELGDVRAHRLGAERAVDADGVGRACEIDVQHASTVCPESVRPEASGIVNETRTGGRSSTLVEHGLDREQRRLQVERVERRLGQQQVGAALEERRAPARAYASTSASNVTRARATGR